MALCATTDEEKMIAVLLQDHPKHSKGPQYPPCDCANPEYGGQSIHERGCASQRPFSWYPDAFKEEAMRAEEVCSSLRALVDAIAGEVAFHPGMHDKTVPAFERARSVLMRLENPDRSPF